jgi:aldose 1-epimerase
MRLEGNAYTTVTSVKNEGNEPFPAGFGHHPYFQRTLTSPDDAVMLEIPCTQYYVANGCIPEGPATTIDPRVDFRKARPLGTVFIDDCLTGRIGAQPIRFSYTKSGVAIAMEMDPIYGHVVYYLPQGMTFFAVEPVTHANDGFNLLERGVAGTGVFVLEPGEEKRAGFTLRVGA